MIKLNKELIKQSKEKMYFEKELKRVEYEPLEDNYIAFDMLTENINYLFDIEGVDFYWYNKNSRNFRNILEDKLYNHTSTRLGEKRAKEVYKNVVDCIEHKDELKIFKKYKQKFIEHFQDVEIEIEIYWNDAGDNNINFDWKQIDNFIRDIEEIEGFSFADWSKYPWGVPELFELIENEIENIRDDIMEEYEMLEIDVKWYSQSDRDVYIIYFHKDDIVKIEEKHGISIQNWEEQVEKAIWSLFTILEVWYSEIYNVKYYNENKEFTKEEEEKEFISSIIVYDISENIEEEIRETEWYSKEIEIEGDF